MRPAHLLAVVFVFQIIDFNNVTTTNSGRGRSSSQVRDALAIKGRRIFLTVLFTAPVDEIALVRVLPL